MGIYELVTLIYAVVFAIASTVLCVLFIRMGDEKGPATVCALIALFCWVSIPFLLMEVGIL